MKNMVRIIKEKVGLYKTILFKPLRAVASRNSKKLHWLLHVRL